MSSNLQINSFDIHPNQTYRIHFTSIQRQFYNQHLKRYDLNGLKRKRHGLMSNQTLCTIVFCTNCMKSINMFKNNNFSLFFIHRVAKR